MFIRAIVSVRRWRTGASLVVAGMLVAGCASGPQAARPQGKWNVVQVGLCEDYPEEKRSLAGARADLDLVRETGATVLRVALGWDAIEAERGVFDWSFWDEFVRLAAARRVQLIPYVCYTPRWAASDPGEDFWRSPPRDPADFQRFMSVVVRRYASTIRTWELWNEPDNRAYWTGTAAQFAALVRAGSAGVRSADPTARVVLGGIATELDFLEQLFREERIAPAVDVVNLHAYYETWHPDPIERLPDWVDGAREIVQEHGEAEPLWLAETGYSSVGGRAVVSEVYRSRFRGEHEEPAQAAALARTVFLALATEQLPVVAWYRINDLATGEEVIGDDNNRHLGLRRVDATDKPARATFAALAALFSTPYQVITPAVKVRDAGSATVETRAFALRDGRQVAAVWIAGQGSAAGEAPLGEDARTAQVELRLPAAQVSGAETFSAGTSGRRGAPEPVRWRQRGAAAELTFSVRGGEVVWCVVAP